MSEQAEATAFNPFKIGDRIRLKSDHKETGTIVKERSTGNAAIVTWDIDADNPEGPFMVPYWDVELIPTPTLREAVTTAILQADHKQKLNGRYGVMADAAIKAVRTFDAKEAAS